jgi:hypothetical protein
MQSAGRRIAQNAFIRHDELSALKMGLRPLGSP